MGQFAEAVVCLRHAVALNPPYAIASAHLFLADALRANGEREAACQEWQLVLGMPSDYPAYESAKQEAATRLAEYCGSVRERGHKR